MPNETHIRAGLIDRFTPLSGLAVVVIGVVCTGRERMASVSRSRLRHVARGEAVSKRQRVLFLQKGADKID